MKIAIVGNGYILKKTLSGKEIDGHDVVVRIHPRSEDARITGLKTDIIAYSESEVERLKDFKAKHLICIGEPVGEFQDHLIAQYGFDKDFLGTNEILERNMRMLANAKPTMSFAPTTGSRVVYYIREKYPNAQITLYGFDFYKGPQAHWDNPATGHDKAHNSRFEEIVVRGYCKSRGIKIEETEKDGWDKIVEPVVEKEPAPIVEEVKPEPVILQTKSAAEMLKAAKDEKRLPNNKK